MFVKPKPGVLVRDPKTKAPLQTGGREVPETSFWLRRLACGDVTLASESRFDVQIPDTHSHQGEG